MTDDATGNACRICGQATHPVGSKRSAWSSRDFILQRCDECGFAFVANPRVDFTSLYDAEYYRGNGADPLVNYLHEMENFDRTIRNHEWRGIHRLVANRLPINPSTRWLDYGCGLGGLVEYLRRSGVPESIGFDLGWSVEYLERNGTPRLTVDDLEASKGSFDVITAIEVVEHTLDPVDELRRIRSLLRPGGLLFLTTGNAAPYRDRLSSWSYVVPDVHISFFEPLSLGLALEQAGFDCEFPGYESGWQEIIRYKVLKTMHAHSDTWLTRVVPWTLAGRVVDARLHPSAHPVGWAR